MLKPLFGPTYFQSELVTIRNRFSHFNMLQGTPQKVDLTCEVNQARQLMAYDRKLKNAISQSIIEMLAREGLKLTWTTNRDHRLQFEKVESEQIMHLNNKTLKETLHSDAYCEMVKNLFTPAETGEQAS